MTTTNENETHPRSLQVGNDVRKPQADSLFKSPGQCKASSRLKVIEPFEEQMRVAIENVRVKFFKRASPPLLGKRATIQ